MKIRPGQGKWLLRQVVYRYVPRELVDRPRWVFGFPLKTGCAGHCAIGPKAPGLLQSNVYQHVALTFNTNSGIAALYLDGTNVATTNLFAASGPFVPRTDGDMLIGWDMSHYTNNYYGGKMDEMSLYSRALTLAEISAHLSCLGGHHQPADRQVRSDRHAGHRSGRGAGDVRFHQQRDLWREQSMGGEQLHLHRQFHVHAPDHLRPGAGHPAG